MADLTVTAANVQRGTGTIGTATGTAGSGITAGQPLYIDTGDSNKLKPTDADGSLLQATVAGIALHAAATGQPITYQTTGLINLGATLVTGETYIASDTAGGISPVADVDNTDYVSYIGYATSSSILKLQIVNTGVVHG